MTQFKTVKTLIVRASVFLIAGISFAHAETVSFETTVPVPFGPFADVLHTASKDGLKTLIRLDECDAVGTKDDTRSKDKQYRCGEIPVGKIVDNNWKLLDQMDLGKDFSDSKGKDTYSFKNAKGGAIRLDLFLSRRQSKDQIQLNTLRTYGKDTVDVSRAFGRDVFIELNPVAGVLHEKACLLAPGITARGSNVRLQGKIKRKDAFCFIWCADARAEGTVDIDFGDIKIGSSKACADIQTEIVDGKPVVTLKDDGEISFHDVQHKGLKVKANMKAKDWISKVLEFFGVEVSEMISKAVATAVKKETGALVDINVKKIKSGEYFKEYLDKAKLKPLVKKLNNELQKSYDKFKPEQKISKLVRDMMCVEPISKLELPLEDRRALLKMCRITLKIDLVSFKNDADSRERGCYKNMFKTHQSSKDSADERAWRQACAFGLALDINAHVKTSPLQKCLLTAWKEQSLPSDTCNEQLADLLKDYDAGQLDALIEQARTIELPTVTDLELKVLRRLALEHLGDETLSLGELSSLLNN